MKICQNCGNPLSTEMAILLESEIEKKNSDLEKRVEMMEEFILKQAHESVKDPNGLKALKDVMKYGADTVDREAVRDIILMMRGEA